jgi:hypothetical protein
MLVGNVGWGENLSQILIFSVLLQQQWDVIAHARDKLKMVSLKMNKNKLLKFIKIMTQYAHNFL